MGTMQHSTTKRELLPPAHVLSRCRRAAEDSPVAALVVSVEMHVVLYANPAACRLLGLPLSKLERQALHTLFDSASGLRTVLEHVSRTQITDVVSALQRSAAAADRFCAVATISAVTEDVGQPVALHVLLTQATDVERASQETLRELKDTNQKLLISGLREQELADKATASEAEVKGLLQRESLLARTSAVLSESLDYETTLRHVARLALPQLADFCVVHMGVGQELRPVAMAHSNPRQEGLLQELARTSVPRVFASAHELTLGTHETCIREQIAEVEWLRHEEEPTRIQLLRELDGRSLMCLPLKTRAGDMGTLTLVYSDSSRRYRVSDRPLAEELAHRASMAIESARLYRSAQISLAQRDDVLAIVSHDLRSPLNAITLTAARMIEELGQSAPVNTFERSALLVRRAADHMRKLIDELLELASIQGQRLTLNYAQADVGHIVTDVLAMLEATAEQRSVSLHQDVGAIDAHAFCDADRIFRALTNLVGNGIKFTPRGGRIDITMEDSGPTLEVKVRDTGPGIQKEHLPHLFEPYWTGRREGASGTGLGLYIARGIIQAHGGSMRVESSLDVGSTFAFTIPKRPPAQSNS